MKDNINLDYLIDKGAIKSCDLHDNEKLVYFDSQGECPVCKALKEASKPKKSAKASKSAVDDVPASVPDYKKGQRIGEGYGKNDAVDRAVAWWNNMPTIRKVIFATIIVLLLWLLLNAQALMTYL